MMAFWHYVLMRELAYAPSEISATHCKHISLKGMHPYNSILPSPQSIILLGVILLGFETYVNIMINMCTNQFLVFLGIRIVDEKMWRWIGTNLPIHFGCYQSRICWHCAHICAEPFNRMLWRRKRTRCAC